MNYDPSIFRNPDNSFTLEAKKFFKSEFEKTFNKVYSYENDPLTKEHSIQTINIMLTEQCNFRCDYCYEDFTNDIIEDSTLKETIEFLYKSKSDKIEFWFFGGEITTVPKKILAATKYVVDLREQYDKKSVTITYFTNGYIFDEVVWSRVSDMLRPTDIQGIVQISYDGLNGMNYARKSLAKKNTDDKVKENIFKFNKYVRVIVRSTLSPENINDDSSILETAQWLERNNISEFAINIVQESHWNEEKSKYFLKQMSELSNWLKKFYTKNPYRKFVVFPFDVIFNRAKKNCGVGSSFVTSNAKGEISPCHVLYSYAKITKTHDNAVWGYLGNVFDGVNPKKMKDYIELDNQKIKMPQCSTCPSTVCNVCPAVSLTTYGDMKSTFREGYCIMMVKLQFIIEEFKQHLIDNCDFLHKDSDWVFLMVIWQNIWNMTYQMGMTPKMDSISFNTYYIVGTSSSYAKFYLKKSLSTYLSHFGFKVVGLEETIDIASKLFNTEKLENSKDFTLDDILHFSSKIYYNVRGSYERSINAEQSTI